MQTECDQMRQLYTLFPFAESNPLHGAQVGRGLGRDMSRLAWWDPRSGITRSDKQSPTSACQFSCSPLFSRAAQTWPAMGRWGGTGEGEIWIRPDPFSFQHELEEGWKKEAFYQRIKLRFIQGLCD